MELGSIKKCNTHGGNVFVLEEYGKLNMQIYVLYFATFVLVCRQKARAASAEEIYVANGE